MKEAKIVRVLTYIYWIPLSVIVLLNAFNSLLRTTYFDLHQYVEIAKYKWDRPLLVLFLTMIMIFFFCVILKINADMRTIKKAVLFWAGIVSLGSVLLFRCIAKCDSGSLNEIAIQFLQDNYQAFEAGEYLYMYPFQLGFTAIMELIYRIFGIENFIVLELINIVCVVDIIWLIPKISEELFEDEKVCKVTAILSMGLLPLFLLATFIYGDIPGWCMAVNSIFYMIRYLKTDKWLEILKASVFLAVGIVMKSNLYIMLAAAVIVIILHAVERKNVKMLVYVIVMIVMSQLGTLAVNSVYSFRTGEKIPEGIPKVAWVAMGMQEPYEDGSAAGWYNGYNWNVYVQNEYNVELTKKACFTDAKQSIQRFLDEPKGAVLFLYEKFTSQWNDPSFMSLLTNEWYSRNVEPQSALAEFFLYGAGRTFLLFIMNVYHFLVFGSMAVFCFCGLKKWSLSKAYLLLNIFGGILFHMLWEAKARYVLFYFVLMVPFAAWGCKKVEERLMYCWKCGAKDGKS